MNTLITYDIVSDKDGKLKAATQTACNFWNQFITPKSSIVVRLGTFMSKGFVIARAYKPYTNKNIVYGMVEFNMKYLNRFTDIDITGTVIHEIGHVLGMGWGQWMDMFNPSSGEFLGKYIKEIPSLQYMAVETNFGPGTKYSHWGEERFDKELMTGFKDASEYVLPVTIEVMHLLGHSIIEELIVKTDLDLLIRQAEGVVFAREDEAKVIDKNYSEQSEIMEELYF